MTEKEIEEDKLKHLSLLIHLDEFDRKITKALKLLSNDDTTNGGRTPGPSKHRRSVN